MEAAVQGADILVVAPTGMGKVIISLIYGVYGLKIPPPESLFSGASRG